MVFCECGCGEEVNPGRRFIAGHQNRGRLPSPSAFINSAKARYKPPIPQKLCECGCGGYANPGRRFIFGHGRIGTFHNASAKKNMSDAQLRDRDPLPIGWQSKLCDITDNKECGTYLGDIAEIILSNIYDSVQVMPINNHGYDIICSREFKIDIKASAIGDKGFWAFTISKNIIADYFLCLAFNNRDDLKNPVHLWLIPGHVVNHLVGLKIRKGTIDKWSEYELSLDKLVACCDNLKV